MEEGWYSTVWIFDLRPRMLQKSREKVLSPFHMRTLVSTTGVQHRLPGSNWCRATKVWSTHRSLPVGRMASNKEFFLVALLAKRCVRDLSVAELKRALLEENEYVLNKLLNFPAPIPARRQNLRYTIHQAVSFTWWLRLSSDDKAMCFAATTQTEASSLGF